MSAGADLLTREREEIRQYADWYAQQGYQVFVEPSPRELPEFLRSLAPDMIAQREGENIVGNKDLFPRKLRDNPEAGRALEHRAGWKLQVVYADLPDLEWQPPPQLPEINDLSARLDVMGRASEDEDQRRFDFLLLWSIVEAAARHGLAALEVPPTSRISPWALVKMLPTEGIIGEDDYALLRRGLAVRNAIAQGFLNQVVDATLFEEIHAAAKALLAKAQKG